MYGINITFGNFQEKQDHTGAVITSCDMRFNGSKISTLIDDGTTVKLKYDDCSNDPISPDLLDFVNKYGFVDEHGDWVFSSYKDAKAAVFEWFYSISF